MRVFLACLLAWALAASSLHAGSVSVWFTYDKTGRIKTARYDNGQCLIYTYDANGNRTRQSNNAGGAPESPVWGAGYWGCFNWTLQSARLNQPANESLTGVAGIRRADGGDRAGR